MKKGALVLFFIIYLLIVAMCIYLLYILYKLNKAGKVLKEAVKYSFFNKKKCGEIECRASEVDLPLPEITGKFEKSIVLYCADLVNRIENSVIDNKEISFPKEMKVLQTLYNISDTNQFGYVLQNGNNLWIIFRGTQNIEEWLQDLSVSQDILPKKNENISQQALFLSGVSETPLIHKGFLEVYSNIKDKIWESVNSVKPEKVVLSGHSLGAAISTIAGLEIANAGYETYVYNFASPRVGNGVFCSLVESKLKQYRIVNTTDVVPVSPLSVTLNIGDPENPFFYSHCGEARYFTSNWMSIVNNHLLGVYTDGIKNKIFKQNK